MTTGPDHLSTGSHTARDRFSDGVSAYRQTRREAARAAEHGEGELVTRGTTGAGLSPDLPARTPIEPTSAFDRAAKLPSLDPRGLAEPVFAPGGWAGTSSADSPSMADHPLLRGLLRELPERGTMPDPAWLDRWFEAARSILELLYVQEARRK